MTKNLPLAKQIMANSITLQTFITSVCEIETDLLIAVMPTWVLIKQNAQVTLVMLPVL